MFIKSDYHPKWTLIVRLVKLRVLKKFGVDCCEGSAKYPSCRAINRNAHPKTGSVVVLTTAHLDGDRSNNRFNNLARLCQRCHLAHDLGHHIMNRRYGRNHSRDHQLTLFNLKPFLKLMRFPLFIALLLCSIAGHTQTAPPGLYWFGRIDKLYTSKLIPVPGSMTYSYVLKTNIPSATVPDTAIWFDPGTKKYKVTMTFTEIVAIDTAWRLLENIEPTDGRVTHVNMITFANSGKPGVTDKSFSAVVDVAKASSSTLPFNGALIEFWGERFQGHSLVDIYIDNVKVISYNQGVGTFNTDLQNGKPTFRKKLSKGAHIISVRGVTGQHIVDFFSVYDYTLTPRP